MCACVIACGWVCMRVCMCVGVGVQMCVCDYSLIKMASAFNLHSGVLSDTLF